MSSGHHHQQCRLAGGDGRTASRRPVDAVQHAPAGAAVRLAGDGDDGPRGGADVKAEEQTAEGGKEEREGGHGQVDWGLPGPSLRTTAQPAGLPDERGQCTSAASSTQVRLLSVEAAKGRRPPGAPGSRWRSWLWPVARLAPAPCSSCAAARGLSVFPAWAALRHRPAPSHSACRRHARDGTARTPRIHLPRDLQLRGL